MDWVVFVFCKCILGVSRSNVWVHINGRTKCLLHHCDCFWVIHSTSSQFRILSWFLQMYSCTKFKFKTQFTNSHTLYLFMYVVDHLKVFVNFSCFISEGPAAGSLLWLTRQTVQMNKYVFPSFNQNRFYFLLHLVWQVRLYSFCHTTRRQHQLEIFIHAMMCASKIQMIWPLLFKSFLWSKA